MVHRLANIKQTESIFHVNEPLEYCVFSADGRVLDDEHRFMASRPTIKGNLGVVELG